MKRDKLACNCENVTYGQIIDSVNSGAETFDEVSEITGCAAGCGKCREFIEIFVRNLIMFPEDNLE
nr:(2Fe-2S)-binding protein [uncultured Catonella sp.]